MLNRPDQSTVLDRELPLCFVSMPMGEDKSDLRRFQDRVLIEIIVPAALDCGYRALRSDQLGLHGDIRSHLIEAVREYSLMIADISGANPSVLYEIGLRHATHKPILQVIEREYERRLGKLWYVKDRNTVNFDVDDPEDSRKRTASQLTESGKPYESMQKKVFVVHGHDHEVKDSVSWLLTSVGLEPVILHEQANLGRAVIEKFEQHSHVGYAVILLTPDDVGGLKSSDTAKFRARARQNVVLELGFFISALGRKRVCVVYSKDLELPSDVSGILYVEYDDSGAWKHAIYKELVGAGIRVARAQLT